jgi:GTP pyrophosphokinase
MQLLTFYESLNDSDKQIIGNALKLAKAYHAGQIRKYNGEDYVNHCIRVAEILIDVGRADSVTVSAALLHDSLEDCEKATRSEISSLCGKLVGNIVVGCTNRFTSTICLRRSQRKLAEINRLAKESRTVREIKLADMIDNVPSICDNDRDFGRVYLSEKMYLYKILSSTDGLNQNLLKMAKEVLDANKFVFGDLK